MDFEKNLKQSDRAQKDLSSEIFLSKLMILALEAIVLYTISTRILYCTIFLILEHSV